VAELRRQEREKGREGERERLGSFKMPIQGERDKEPNNDFGFFFF
jgi:hypothetical protein